ncbi:hypothetical protein QO058_12825 [Bosea vestrisii]|nr:hypothetical protein [Bosea vestrisii]WID99049.1 hypothetical protein QO058_12825 [Bosea vestrisii]
MLDTALEIDQLAAGGVDLRIAGGGTAQALFGIGMAGEAGWRRTVAAAEQFCALLDPERAGIAGVIPLPLLHLR